MSTRIRNLFITVASVATLGLAASAWAGVNSPEALEKLRDGGNDNSSQPQQQPQQQRPRAEAQSQRAAAAPQRDRGPSGGGGGGGYRGGGDRGGVSGGAPSRDYGTSGRDNRGTYRGDNRGSYTVRPGHAPVQPRVVNRLPSGYRHYNWNGRPYYSYGGHWYSPYGGSYVSIGVPFGLFVSTLPGYSSSFYYGSTRYYYADDTYYTYEPVRRGYVVARSPYGDDGDEDYSGDTSSTRDEDLYIYPAKGQSEQQQADDRYECHRWAANETKYDPIDDEYSPAQRADYQRAMTACLTGRGYTVR